MPSTSIDTGADATTVAWEPALATEPLWPRVASRRGSSLHPRLDARKA